LDARVDVPRKQTANKQATWELKPEKNVKRVTVVRKKCLAVAKRL
jgi:hypothetical protein